MCQCSMTEKMDKSLDLALEIMLMMGKNNEGSIITPRYQLESKLYPQL